MNNNNDTSVIEVSNKSLTNNMVYFFKVIFVYRVVVPTFCVQWTLHLRITRLCNTENFVSVVQFEIDTKLRLLAICEYYDL